MSHQTNSYEFGPYHLDLRTRVLMRGGEGISLAPKATDILVMLVTNAGQLVEKDELLKGVWPDSFVEESNLTQNIFMLRKALGDNRTGSKYIETIAKRGYRFVAPVKPHQALENQSATSEGGVAKTVADSGKPIIAVLPFVNSHDDSSLDYLASALTDNLIHQLSNFRKVHVMSRSLVIRYKTDMADPRQAGKELGVDAVFVGRITSRSSGILIDIELVDVCTGWQLWGHSFESETKDLHAVQEAIAQEVLRALSLSLTVGEKSRVTSRYTESTEAYRCYLEGRAHWSKNTRRGIETAIRHFGRAIASDPNYALAYAGIVDCFLRLATNYLPPEDVDVSSETPGYVSVNSNDLSESSSRVKLRLEWDCKGAERELRRANELKIEFPSGHQWFAAYRATRHMYEESCASANGVPHGYREYSLLPHTQIALLELTPNEEVQVYCAIGREQIDIGNYKAACKVLGPWWSFGVWPKMDGLDQRTAADLLLTVGVLAGCEASTKQLPRGQRHSEELLNGSIALFEQLGIRTLAAEARIELGFCYFRQGLYDVGGETLTRALHDLSDDFYELRSLALIRLATLERCAGRSREALSRLWDATKVTQLCGPWATGRCHLELASAYKELAKTEKVGEYFGEAKLYYSKALYEFESIGHYRLSAITENNLGLVMLHTGNIEEAESHLLRARKTFNSFDDKIRSAQVDDSLAQLYLNQGRFDDADLSIQRAVHIMENGDEDALLVEALTTKGKIYCKLKRNSQAKTLLENAYRLAQRCGDTEGAGRALAVLVEELFDLLELEERSDLADRIRDIISHSQNLLIYDRLQKCLKMVMKTSSSRSD